MKHWVKIETIPFLENYGQYKKQELLFCEGCWQRVADAMRSRSETGTVRFFVGEVYEAMFESGARRAIVEQIWDDGRRGRLRFLDNEELFESRWMELHQAGKWHRIAIQ